MDREHDRSLPPARSGQSRIPDLPHDSAAQGRKDGLVGGDLRAGRDRLGPCRIARRLGRHCDGSLCGTPGLRGWAFSGSLGGSLSGSPGLLGPTFSRNGSLGHRCRCRFCRLRWFFCGRRDLWRDRLGRRLLRGSRALVAPRLPACRNLARCLGNRSVQKDDRNQLPGGRQRRLRSLVGQEQQQGHVHRRGNADRPIEKAAR